MSYRCSVCGTKVPHGKQRLVHVVYRPRTRQIQTELPVCGGCQVMLEEIPLSAVRDPYYLRPKRGARTTILVEHEPAYNPPPTASEIGRPARTVTL